MPQRRCKQHAPVAPAAMILLAGETPDNGGLAERCAKLAILQAGTKSLRCLLRQGCSPPALLGGRFLGAGHAIHCGPALLFGDTALDANAVGGPPVVLLLRFDSGLGEVPAAAFSAGSRRPRALQANAVSAVQLAAAPDFPLAVFALFQIRHCGLLVIEVFDLGSDCVLRM